MFTLRLTAGRLILSQKISVRILEGDPEITFPLSYPGDGAALLMRNEDGSSPSEGAKTRYCEERLLAAKSPVCACG